MSPIYAHIMYITLWLHLMHICTQADFTGDFSVIQCGWDSLIVCMSSGCFVKYVIVVFAINRGQHSDTLLSDRPTF